MAGLMVKIRDYRADDVKEVADLFFHTVRTVNATVYTPDQLEAWAPEPIDYDRWKFHLDSRRPIVATIDDVIAGFCELEPNGHVDCFYVHRSYQRKGVGDPLMREMIQRAVNAGLTRLCAEVSITARTFFQRYGFDVVRDNVVVRNGVQLKNFIMERLL